MNKYLVIAILVALGLWFYKKYAEPTSPVDTAPQSAAVFSEPASNYPPAESSQPTQPIQSSQSFNCDGRTRCPQMTSCAEATYFIQNCPGTKMDGNGDGVPCESQWCS